MATSAMKKAGKPSKVVKPTKRKTFSTPTTRNHRYEPFTERIAKLKIDPIRRRRVAEDGGELSEDTATYTGRSLADWKDLNLSQTFTAFAKDVSPYCDNLPLVLHSEEKIMDLLVLYVEKADALAMEPLLSLFSHFAHDLDIRFEKHFQRAVATIAAVASKHQDPAVVEWSFTCLAWLFKYLSRLLAPDLRSLYDLMAPYLGKAAQKTFIVRFAAESLSFLLRKAATTYEREPEPLDRIMQHILEDVASSQDGRSSDMYRQGVMTLLTDAITSVQHGVHTSGKAVVTSLLHAALALSEKESSMVQSITAGVITSVIHHTTPVSFPPVMETVASVIDAQALGHAGTIHLASSWILTMSSARMGERITDWTALVKATLSLFDAAKDVGTIEDKVASSLLRTLAVVMQTASIDATLPMVNIVKTLRSGPYESQFLPFCDLFARLGRERYEALVAPEFQRFVTERWEAHTDSICTLLSTLVNLNSGREFRAPSAMQDALLDDVDALASNLALPAGEVEQKCVAANTALSAFEFVKLGDVQRRRLQDQLRRVLQHVLDTDTYLTDSARDFALGSCFRRLLDVSDSQADLAEMWLPLCAKSRVALTVPAYLANMLRLIKLCKPSGADLTAPSVVSLEDALIRALALPSHDVRQASLELLQEIYTLRDLPIPGVLSAANAIESTPISLESSRAISMNIRRLASSYLDAESDALMQRAIPTFCFGLLHLRLSQAWDDAVIALAEMCKQPIGEETMISIAQAWLDGTPEQSDEQALTPLLDSDTSSARVASDFECSNLAKVDAICQQVFEDGTAGYPSPDERFRLDHQHVPSISPSARTQALMVLNKVPQIAEKRSRLLVPVLLRWAGSLDHEELDETVSGQRWSRKDQKAMLGIFAQFNNPRVLFRSAEVHEALLNLCGNGDVEIQRSALKALCAWKEPAIVRYEEHLTNLLDEARFREEISVFLQDSTDEETVRPEDYAVVMPVLLRLLYGRAVAGGSHGQEARRKAIFVALSRFGPDTLGQFIAIAMPATPNQSESGPSRVETNTPLRKQVGMLNMLSDLLDTLGAELQPFVGNMLGAVISCSVAASKQIEGPTPAEEIKDGSLLRNIRQTGLQCLVTIFSSMDVSAFDGESRMIVRDLVAPRLDKFASENTQSVSAMLRLFAAWSTSLKTTPFLTSVEPSLLSRVADLLQDANTKIDVRLYVLRQVLDTFLSSGTDVAAIQPSVSKFVRSIGDLLRRQPPKDVLDACVKSLTLLATHITDSDEASDIVAACAELLAKPNKAVSPWTKTGLLRTVLPLVSHFHASTDGQLFDSLCGLFSRLKDPEARTILAEVFVQVCRSDALLAVSASICLEMNAPGGRLDEPDHMRREQGFSTVFAQSNTLSLRQWLPIVHNCMFFIRDAEDMVNRSSASQALERFVRAGTLSKESFEQLTQNVILVGIERGMLESSELVRAEYLRLLGCIVKTCVDWPVVNSMQVLTVDGDDEASVFTNILHIQQHRRLRALRRLSDEAPRLNSNNIAKIIIPLLEHFVFDQADADAGRTLADQTVQTLGALARSLNWSSFRAVFKRYIGYIASKEDLEKTVLRLLGALVDALKPDVDSGADEQDDKLKAQKSEIVKRDFIPPLMEYLHRKDESTVDRRMPVAITIAKLFITLPGPEMRERLPPVLTDISHVLRSRSQEARDQTRKTLAAILALLGPSYLGFIVKELRSALQRGYQLHVLSFTVHSLLVGITPICKPGELDHCLADLTTVIMDDIFGITGQEKDAEEYKSGMKEVKSSKSFDTMELLARVTPVGRLGRLIQPTRALLGEKLDAKMTRKIDELLTRLRKGVDQNPAADSRDMLSFCHEIVRQVYAEQAAASVKEVLPEYKIRKYLIQMEAANKSASKGATASQLFKLVSFALNLVRKVVRRHDDLLTPANMAGFLPMAGDALVKGQAEVKLSAVRLLATIIRVPLPELDKNIAVYVKEAVNLVKSATSMTDDSVKAGLELITAVLRDKRDVAIKEADIAHVLRALKPDIDEPDRQGVTYKFLRAVLGRSIVITEVYELMDEVGKVMVTNADRNVRESARSAYLQFVLDYPQGKDRWNKQANFFVENLRYEHASGRQSIMELLHHLLAKIGEDVLGQLAFTFFVALVPVQVSDVDQSCRHMAGLLISKLFETADSVQLKAFASLLDKWLDNNEKPMIQVAAVQCWTSFLKTRRMTTKQSKSFREKIGSMLTSEDVVVGPQLLQTILQALTVMMETAPDTAFSQESSDMWDSVRQSLLVANVELQEAASALIGGYLTHLASSSSKLGQGLAQLPIRGSEGLELDGDGMRQMCRTNLRVLFKGSYEMTDILATQTVRNLAFLGRCFAANDMLWQESEDDVEDSAADEEDVAPEDSKHGSSALAYLFNRLSYIIRQETLVTPARVAALQCQAALVNQVQSIPDLQTLVRPLYSLTDPSIPQPSSDAHRNLIDRARELLDAIQKKVGTEAYVKALSAARNEAKAKREERRQKRKIGAVSAPEKWARDKKRKHDVQKEKSKLKGMEARGKRRGW